LNGYGNAFAFQRLAPLVGRWVSQTVRVLLERQIERWRSPGKNLANNLAGKIAVARDFFVHRRRTTRHRTPSRTPRCRCRCTNAAHLLALHSVFCGVVQRCRRSSTAAAGEATSCSDSVLIGRCNERLHYACTFPFSRQFPPPPPTPLVSGQCRDLVGVCQSVEPGAHPGLNTRPACGSAPSMGSAASRGAVVARARPQPARPRPARCSCR
jgi:hypothetical protein